MSNELTITGAPSGSALAAIQRRLRDRAAFNRFSGLYEAPAAIGNWASYAVPLVEDPAGSSQWYGNRDSGTWADAIEVVYYQQAGINLAESDRILASENMGPQGIALAPPPGGTAAGWYSSQARIELLARSLGDVFSNVNNDSTAPDITRYQAALNRTDNTINALAALADYVVPLAASASFPGGTSGSAFGYIQDRADVLALWDLYSLPRGAYDAPGKDPTADKLKGLADAARQELIDLFESGVLTAARNAGYVSAPAALDTFDAWGHRIDASGNRLDAPPPIYWPLWRR